MLQNCFKFAIKKENQIANQITKKITTEIDSRLRKYFEIKEEVQNSLKNKKPVVALETTIVTHGMPYPKNVEIAQEVEQIVRENGATPATIGVINGKIHVGMTKNDLEFLAQQRIQGNVTKVSRRDLSFVVSQKKNGGTTVSGTMMISHMAGIPVFVTGGIGGVHRNAEITMDISADLMELMRTPICVVCAGMKSILDIPKTLEFLETNGVPTVGYQVKNFPAFFVHDSGFPSSCRLDDPKSCAQLIKTNSNLGIKSGILIGVPVPKKYETEGVMIENAIQKAIQESQNQKISGRDLTPFLLARVNELTQGKSLQTNTHLIKNNAKIGAQIAVELSKL
ncbi:hypothetical protein M0811_00206 [Anaeramoeba ignava]|uniref:Pseudouridine-5'-phosphate glycosidase n=1 Tax=Anaeramoeba ignava TaxID=1746090 RepID=A0A9Q0RE74_ANAIG|nr:hypothetical protein M0811_00206 [Anaeramoeba ignava]